MKRFIVLLIIISLVIPSIPAYAHDDDDHMGSVGIWMPVMVVGMVVGYLFFRHHHKQSKSDDALETLKRRYASGEITKEQYIEMKKDIKEDKK
jgi:putative membrane protein